MNRIGKLNWRIDCGDVRERLASLPDASVQTCVTSPPYWGLRDYGHAEQIGLEATPAAYVAALVQVFAEVRRVLKDDGTLWLNLGDSYAGLKGFRPEHQATSTLGPKRDGLKPCNAAFIDKPRGFPVPDGLKAKDLVGIPWRVAFALQADGWYLRSDIIWSKPNPMPESVTDRPTRAHEYIFLLSKRERYYYDAAAIRRPPARPYWRDETRTEPGNPDRNDGGGIQARPLSSDKQRGHGRRHAGFNDRWDQKTKADQSVDGANARTVWTVATQPYPEAHFATFPEALIKPCILAGSRIGDTVLDPFCGSGTTGAVAIRHQRNFIGIELNAEYVQLARRRIAAVAPLFSDELTVGGISPPSLDAVAKGR